MLTVAGRLHEKSGQALDQRTKFARWMQEFQLRGGNLVIKTVTLDDLEQIAVDNALTFVAAGKGPINALFARDDARSRHQSPPRQLAALLLRGSKMLGERPWPKADFRPLRFNFVMGVGEFFSLLRSIRIPQGSAAVFCLRRAPGGPMDPLQRRRGRPGVAEYRPAGGA
ncbi:styrene monooxygenase/indole monooxygenase family protein [Cupriavidus basilensis]